MKKTLFILFLVPVIANAQRPNDMPFRYNFADSVYLSKFTASLPLKLNVNKSVYSAKITVSESDTAVGAGIAGWLRLQKHADSLGALIGAKMTNPMSTTGDMIYSSSGSTPARLAIGTNGFFLKVVAGVPTWSDISSTLSYGTYTPTRTDVANISSSSASDFHYSRNGTQVTIGGTFLVTPTAGSTNTSISFNIPATSNFSLSGDASGSGTAIENTTRVPVSLTADAANDRINLQFTSINTNSHEISFTCVYSVLP